MAEGAMSTFLGSIGTFFTQAIAWMGEALTTITENPALTVVVFGMLISGFIVSLLTRLIRVG